MTALALTLALGVVLGVSSRVPALLLVLFIIMVGGGLGALFLGTPPIEILGALVMVQFGYLGASYARIRPGFRDSGETGVAEPPPLGLRPPDL